MSVYLVVQSKVLDAEAYGVYLKAVAPLVKRYGGRFLVRGGKVTPMVGDDWHPERMIVIEFPSEESVREWFACPEYQEILPYRKRGAEVNAVLLEGLEEQP